MKNIISLVMGDRSGDGHGKTDTVIIKSNLSKKDLEKAYKKAIKIIGFDLAEVASEYEDNYISEKLYLKLKKAGFTEDYGESEDEKYQIFSEAYADIYLFFIKIGEPKFEYEIVDSSNSINIGGYGLFY